MQSINHILKDFDHKTIARSVEYAIQISPADLTYEKKPNGEMNVIALIRGQFKYETELQYDQKGYLKEAFCSCPVGYYCKHGAALARFVYQQQIEAKVADTFTGHLQSISARHSTAQLTVQPLINQNLQYDANVWWSVLKPLQRWLKLRL